MLKPYACQDAAQASRVFSEPPCPFRSAFARDRDRISRSYAFRRLKRTTQVFPSGEHPMYRTRLTHSMEVAQTARILARNLNVNEDLSEAVALAHDLGHPPFGHGGEDALNDCTKPWFPFNHNDQTFRWLVLLEKSYGAFDGLNLSWDTLEGIVKHSGPLKNDDLDHLPTIRHFSDYKMDLGLHTHASLEAQIAAIADDITYITHDVEDALIARFITFDDLRTLPYFDDLFKQHLQQFPSLDHKRFYFELARHSLQQMVRDVLETTKMNLQRLNPKTVRDIRMAGETQAHFSAEMEEHVLSIKSFLMKRVYQSSALMGGRQLGAKKIKKLFGFLLDNPSQLPKNWQPSIHKCDTSKDAEAAIIRSIADYIASRTEFDFNETLEKYNLLEDIA